MNPFRINYAEELKPRIGFPVSENRSPTLRAKLIKINKKTCTMEVIQSPYRHGDESRIGERYLVPTAYVWNAYFF